MALLSLKLDFNNSEELQTNLEKPCTRVLDHFQLPALRLYCYFAVVDDPYLPGYAGQNYRGLHVPAEGRDELPSYNIRECFFDLSTGQIAFDNLIYLRASTCLDTTRCAVTLAHELQHLMQHFYSRKVWAASTILYWNFGSPTETAIDFPHEREANISSKRVAEAVCGADVIQAFAEKQVAEFAELVKHGEQSAVSEKIRWEFFRDVSSVVPYDLLRETIPLVEKYRQRLIASRFGRDFGIDFSKQEWWL